MANADPRPDAGPLLEGRGGAAEAIPLIDTRGSQVAFSALWLMPRVYFFVLSCVGAAHAFHTDPNTMALLTATVPPFLSTVALTWAWFVLRGNKVRNMLAQVNKYEFSKGFVVAAERKGLVIGLVFWMYINQGISRSILAGQGGHIMITTHHLTGGAYLRCAQQALNTSHLILAPYMVMVLVRLTHAEIDIFIVKMLRLEDIRTASGVPYWAEELSKEPGLCRDTQSWRELAEQHRQLSVRILGLWNFTRAGAVFGLVLGYLAWEAMIGCVNFLNQGDRAKAINLGVMLGLEALAVLVPLCRLNYRLCGTSASSGARFGTIPSVCFRFVGEAGDSEGYGIFCQYINECTPGIKIFGNTITPGFVINHSIRLCIGGSAGLALARQILYPDSPAAAPLANATTNATVWLGI